MFICVCHVTWVSFPSFFYCIPDNGWKLCLLCCWDAVGSELQQGYLAMSGAEGGSQDLLLRFGVGEEGGKCWCKSSSGVHWGPACPMSAVESAKHRNYLKTTLVQSHSPLNLCFVLEGDCKREILCVLIFRGC